MASRNASGIWPALLAKWNCTRASLWRPMPFYKPLHSTFSPGQGITVLTWDFPVLAKYHVAKLGRAPFIEAGPSFRAAGNLNGYDPSHFGVTAGAGAETRERGVLLSTALRYTRWEKDAPSIYGFSSQGDYSRTNANAVELIFGVGY